MSQQTLRATLVIVRAGVWEIRVNDVAVITGENDIIGPGLNVTFNIPAILKFTEISAAEEFITRDFLAKFDLPLPVNDAPMTIPRRILLSSLASEPAEQPTAEAKPKTWRELPPLL